MNHAHKFWWPQTSYRCVEGHQNLRAWFNGANSTAFFLQLIKLDKICGPLQKTVRTRLQRTRARLANAAVSNKNWNCARRPYARGECRDLQHSYEDFSLRRVAERTGYREIERREVQSDRALISRRGE